MLLIPIPSRYFSITHFCVFSAIIILSSAKFHTWNLNPMSTYKSRYTHTNYSSSLSSSYYQGPLLSNGRSSFQIYPNNLQPSKTKSNQQPYKRNAYSKPTASICRRPGYFSYPNDCKRFYRCVGTQQIVSEVFNTQQRFTIFHFVCPSGTIFDQRVQVCNHPWAAQCKETPTDSQNEISVGIHDTGTDNTLDDNGGGANTDG